MQKQVDTSWMLRSALAGPTMEWSARLCLPHPLFGCWHSWLMVYLLLLYDGLLWFLWMLRGSTRDVARCSHPMVAARDFARRPPSLRGHGWRQAGTGGYPGQDRYSQVSLARIPWWLLCGQGCCVCCHRKCRLRALRDSCEWCAKSLRAMIFSHSMSEDEHLGWHRDDSRHQLFVVLDALPTRPTEIFALWIGAQPWRSLVMSFSLRGISVCAIPFGS